MPVGTGRKGPSRFHGGGKTGEQFAACTLYHDLSSGSRSRDRKGLCCKRLHGHSLDANDLDDVVSTVQDASRGGSVSSLPLPGP